MEFDSLGEDYDFYNGYAITIGFGIRKYSSKKGGGDEGLVMKEFVCCKQRKKVDVNLNPIGKGDKADVRSDCRAKVALLKPNGHNKFVVPAFKEQNYHVASGGIRNSSCIPKDMYNVKWNLMSMMQKCLMSILRMRKRKTSHSISRCKLTKLEY
ncbi:protein FAR1-RELATED SEQUENCE 5-like [Pyrus ussuriensis x Pyrus communis]|uniref:Protein FAR1-RELATED SEQUENCE 5-like n=1 Tax=Pyrus ussuriensis x Pyrus communis TaxID=2448454 RepID=A0A5N5H3J9_9ROSA|nr:protein FAR1-RELATED SEQUENCE 5-like [Pyrus ussuriensis x Pyrus communis]